MAFILKGEVEIDGRKGTTVLKGLQREATKTSDTFKRAGTSTERLGKSLLGLSLNAGRAGTSLGALTRLGTGGLFGAAVLGSINKFGETIKQASSDYYSAQKDLASAFETSFRSTSVEQAQAGLEKTEDTIESLRGKITQLGAFAGVLEGIEKFTGLSLGVGDTKRALQQAQEQLIVQEEIVKLKQREKEETEKIQKESRTAVLISKQTEETLKFVKEMKGGREILVDLASQELKQAVALRDENYKLLDVLIQTNREGNNKEQINARNIKAAELELGIYKAQNNVIRAQKAERAAEAKRAQEVGGGLLGASRGGQQALEVATKQRSRGKKTEDFKTQEAFFNQQRDEENKRRAAQGLPPVTAQRMKEKMAAQQAAAANPTLAEQIQGGQQGIDPAQIAMQRAGESFEASRSLGGKAMTPTEGALGVEKSSLGKEAQNAISELVKIMTSLDKKLPAAVAQ